MSSRGLEGVMPETIIVRSDGPVVRVQINRPDANNSINTLLVQELHAVLDSAEKDSTARVFVLEGLPDVFCSGNDFDALAAAGSEQLSDEADVQKFFDLLIRLGAGPLISVAVVQGRAQAGGVGIVAACDLALAAPTASFALSEMLFGLVPACVLPFIGRRIGMRRARHLALTTLPLNVSQALDWGLIDESADNLDRLLKLRLSRLSCLDRDAVVRLKNFVGQLEPIGENVRQLAVGTITPLINDPAIREGIRRFVQEGVYPWQTPTSESRE